MGDDVAKLPILSPSYRGNTSPEPIPAIERYGGPLYRVVRDGTDVREKDVYVVTVTEDLGLVSPGARIPRKSSTGNKRRTVPPATRDPGKLRNRILEIVKSEEYDKVFIALNKHYRQLLPDLTPHTRKLIADFKGLGAKALKERLS